MRILTIGDPHAKRADLEECWRLSEFVSKCIDEEKPDVVLVLGDLYHNHGVMDVYVLDYWRRTLQLWKRPGMRIFLVVGNHDMPGDGARVSALLAHEPQDYVRVVQDVEIIGPGVWAMGYHADGERFVGEASRLSGKTLYCHQTFQGCTFENGFYAKEGIEAQRLPFENVISGHIHAPQRFGKVWYPGSPRWQTISDANVDRAIHVIEHDLEGAVVSTKELSVAGVCRRIEHRQDTPENPLQGPLDPAHRWFIDIIGPSAWVEARKPLWAEATRLRTFVTDRREAKVRESEGIDKALLKYIDSYQPKHGTELGTLRDLALERLKQQSWVVR